MFVLARKTMLAAVLLLPTINVIAQPGTITTIAGRGTLSNAAANNNPATNASLNPVGGICVDNSGNFYIPQQRAVRKVNSGGTLTTIAGTDTVGYAGDGNPATDARINGAMSVVADHAGNLYFSEVQNYVVRKVDNSGIITTYAGNGTHGNHGNGGPAVSCELGWIYDMAVDKDDNLYMADYQNHVVWQVNTAGYINIVAGTLASGNSGDGGPATNALLGNPAGVAVDNDGNLYIADNLYHVIRKVDNLGNISTIAGTGTAGYNGDGLPSVSAQLNAPRGMGVDVVGSLYVAEWGNNRVRKIYPGGTITTVAGNGTAGFGGDGGPAVLANLSYPSDVAADDAGNIYISEVNNRCVRMVTSTLAVRELFQATVIVSPNPSRGSLSISALTNGPVDLFVENITGQTVYTASAMAIMGQQINLDLPAALPNGKYNLRYSGEQFAGRASLLLAR